METVEVANPRLRHIAVTAKPRPWRHLLWGVSLEVLAWSGAAFGALINLLLVYQRGAWDWTSWLWQVPGFFAVFFSVTVVRRRAGRFRVNARRKLTRDKRDPVLYLRSFYDDYEESQSRADRKTAEELLTAALGDVGPVVTVGRPKELEGEPGGRGEALPLLGAARVYFKNEDWRGNVSYLISIARLVVLQANISQGLQTEMDLVRARLGPTPEKLLVSFLSWEHLDRGTREEQYRSFRGRAESLLNCSFPDRIGGASFMYFDSRWEGKMLSVRLRHKVCFGGLNAGAIRASLRPVLARAGLKLSVLRSSLHALKPVTFVACCGGAFYLSPVLGILFVVVSSALTLPAVRTLLEPWWAR